MTPSLLVTLLIAALLLCVVAVWRFTRAAQSGSSDLGMVSSRWIAELRRDEPWTRS